MAKNAIHQMGIVLLYSNGPPEDPDDHLISMSKFERHHPHRNLVQAVRTVTA